MARINVFDVTALEDVVKRIIALPEAVRKEVRSKGTKAAGEIVREYMRGSLAAKVYPHRRNGKKPKVWQDDLIDTKELSESLFVDPHDMFVEVYPKGTRAGSEKRNAEVGFMLEYGSSGFPAFKWISQAAEAAADDVAKAVAEQVDLVLSKL
jgi:hypothetical protein